MSQDVDAMLGALVLLREQCADADGKADQERFMAAAEELAAGDDGASGKPAPAP